MGRHPLRILVCGGRDYLDIPQAYQQLSEIVDERCPGRSVVIIHGCARGIDSMAGAWASDNWLVPEEYPAKWDKYGKSAGYIRNKQMLDEGKPDLVVAFAGGRGTKMMIELAERAGVEVIKVGAR